MTDRNKVRGRANKLGGGYDGAAEKSCWSAKDGIADGDGKRPARRDRGRTVIGRRVGGDFGRALSGALGQRPMAGSWQDMRSGRRRRVVGTRRGAQVHSYR